MARAIPQRIPNAEAEAQAEPGVRSVHHRGTALDVKSERKSPLRTPVYRRGQNERGISSGMNLEDHGKNKGMTIPLPIRSTLAQKIAVYRVQVSHYISRVRPFGMRPDYPTAHVLTLIKTSPAARTNNPRPRGGGYNLPQIPLAGGTANRGNSPYYMRGPTRFRKALPTQLNPYTPPTY